jgi:sulfate transport system permease protein
MPRRPNKRGILPGFGLSMGITLLFVTLVVLIPLSTVVLKTSSIGFDKFWATVTTDRALASYWVTFSSSLVAAVVNVIFGLIVAWALVRYRFPGRGLLDAVVDLPFAVPTAVSGIALTALYSSKGWAGKLLAPLGLKIAFTPLGISLALTFVTLPFVIRTVQPVLEELDPDAEESAALLGAGRFTTFVRVILPNLVPALMTGFALSFARAIGEYGSVVFISGNMPMRTEIAPLLIMTKLEQFDYAGATSIALVMLVASFVLLLAVNRLQAWTRARTGYAS